MKLHSILIIASIVSQATGDEFNKEKINLHCTLWPEGWPKEHHDTSCNRVLQNTVLAKDVAARDKPAPISAFLNIPEEKTWVCPLDESNSLSSGQIKHPVIGRATRWILYNHASTPIIIERVNGSSLMDEGKFLKSAVYPNGPIVLPGDMAVVNGYQGQLFTAREFKEDASLITLDNEYSKSFRSAMPQTWSFADDATRFTTGRDGVEHVLGSPGRVLMKHRMGMIHIKNDYGAICPEAPRELSMNANRSLSVPIDLEPDCNYVEKGLINKVGCDVDLYFAPPPADANSTFNCESHLIHMSSLENFLDSGLTLIDSFGGPVFHLRTYDTHSFVVRTSHDKTLVSRINIDADRVYDCPDPKRGIVQAEMKADRMTIQPRAAQTNSTELDGNQGHMPMSKWDYYHTNVTAFESIKIAS